jgi:mRNA-degrading endonuclease YafQ of YafQ-DinJ toxin-antitoxin module
MQIKYKPSFLREFKKLPFDIQEEAREKIVLFQDVANHQRLKVHKLQGKLKDFSSFSITYSHRIIFIYEADGSVVLVAVGTHGVYQ